MLGAAALGAQPAKDVAGHHARYDPRNFDGVWNLAEGGKFGPVTEKNGVKFVEYPFTPARGPESAGASRDRNRDSQALAGRGFHRILLHQRA
jgi:hypothetical protein